MLGVLDSGIRRLPKWSHWNMLSLTKIDTTEPFLQTVATNLLRPPGELLGKLF